MWTNAKSYSPHMSESIPWKLPGVGQQSCSSLPGRCWRLEGTRFPHAVLLCRALTSPAKVQTSEIENATDLLNSSVGLSKTLSFKLDWKHLMELLQADLVGLKLPARWCPWGNPKWLHRVKLLTLTHSEISLQGMQEEVLSIVNANILDIRHIQFHQLYVQCIKSALVDQSIHVPQITSRRIQLKNYCRNHNSKMNDITSINL